MEVPSGLRCKEILPLHSLAWHSLSIIAHSTERTVKGFPRGEFFWLLFFLTKKSNWGSGQRPALFNISILNICSISCVPKKRNPKKGTPTKLSKRFDRSPRYISETRPSASNSQKCLTLRGPLSPKSFEWGMKGFYTKSLLRFFNTGTEEYCSKSSVPNIMYQYVSLFFNRFCWQVERYKNDSNATVLCLSFLCLIRGDRSVFAIANRAQDIRVDTAFILQVSDDICGTGR
jgi:hypothetical protein